MRTSKQILTENLQEYLLDNQVLKKLQNEIFTIFDDVYNACKKNNIPLYIMHGTLLGAVRHKGFIPWDDDIDAVSYAKDFPKIIDAVSKEYPNKYEFAGLFYDYNKNPFFALKIMKKNSSFVELTAENYPNPKGIFIDIFPIFPIPTNKFKRKLLSKKIDFLVHVGTLGFEYKYSPNKLFHINKKVRSYYLKRRALGFFCRPFYTFSRKKLLKYFYQTKYSKYFAINTVIGFDKYLVDNTILNNVSLYEFNGKLYESFADYDYLLKAQYGDDYMVLPPVEKREVHIVLDIKFNNEN